MRSQPLWPLKLLQLLRQYLSSSVQSKEAWDVLSSVLYHSLCIDSILACDATVVVKTERNCRVLFCFRHILNQYQDSIILLTDLNLVLDYGHYFILNVELPRNIQIRARSIVIVPFVKYAFHASVRICEMFLDESQQNFKIYWLFLFKVNVFILHLAITLMFLDGVYRRDDSSSEICLSEH